MPYGRNTFSRAWRIKGIDGSRPVQSLKASVNRFYQEGKIDNAGIRDSLLDKLNTAQAYLNQGNIKAAKNAL